MNYNGNNQLKINQRTSYGKALLELIKLESMKKKGVEIVDENERDSATIEDVEKGKAFKVKNSKDLFKELGI